jgi:hypothetical protein
MVVSQDSSVLPAEQNGQHQFSTVRVRPAAAVATRALPFPPQKKHIDWLEAQLELIKQVGEQNYLSEQIHK